MWQKVVAGFRLRGTPCSDLKPYCQNPKTLNLNPALKPNGKPQFANGLHKYYTARITDTSTATCMDLVSPTTITAGPSGTFGWLTDNAPSGLFMYHKYNRATGQHTRKPNNEQPRKYCGIQQTKHRPLGVAWGIHNSTASSHTHRQMQDTAPHNSQPRTTRCNCMHA